MEHIATEIQLSQEQHISQEQSISQLHARHDCAVNSSGARFEKDPSGTLGFRRWAGGDHLRQDKSQIPVCRDNFRGNCACGASCKYQHSVYVEHDGPRFHRHYEQGRLRVDANSENSQYRNKDNNSRTDFSSGGFYSSTEGHDDFSLWSRPFKKRRSRSRSPFPSKDDFRCSNFRRYDSRIDLRRDTCFDVVRFQYPDRCSKCERPIYHANGQQRFKGEATSVNPCSCEASDTKLGVPNRCDEVVSQGLLLDQCPNSLRVSNIACASQKSEAESGACALQPRHVDQNDEKLVTESIAVDRSKKSEAVCQEEFESDPTSSCDEHLISPEAIDLNILGKKRKLEVTSNLDREGDGNTSDLIPAMKTYCRKKQRKRCHRSVSCEDGMKEIVEPSKHVLISSSSIPKLVSVSGIPVDKETRACKNNFMEDMLLHDPPAELQENERTNKICKTVQSELATTEDVTMLVGNTDSHSLQASQYSLKASVSVSKRKLLVLDVNGLLADIVAAYPPKYKPDTTVSRKAVFKRPFCDEFLQFCFDRFDVGIWSSRTKKNVMRVVDFLLKDKKRLLFCWDQSHCTATGYNTIENREKPLILKELKNLWDNKGETLPWSKGYYNEKNTVLLDVSPYKALRNPPYTAIFPHPYSFKHVQDKSLGPGGKLHAYLECLAEAENIQKYIQENPFGQRPITEKNVAWNFYAKIVGASDSSQPQESAKATTMTHSTAMEIMKKGKRNKKVRQSIELVNEYERERLGVIASNLKRMEAQGGQIFLDKQLQKKARAVQSGNIEESNSNEIEEQERSSRSNSPTNINESRDELGFDDMMRSEAQVGSQQMLSIPTVRASKKKRGPSRRVQLADLPMYLEFDEFDNPVGEWSHQYGVHIGSCAMRNDINLPSYLDLDKVQKNKNWEEAKKLFNIQDPNGKREEKFHAKVGQRFSKWKSYLRNKFLKCKVQGEEESPHGIGDSTNKDGEEVQKIKAIPWIVYDGVFTEEQWKIFETNYLSPDFQVISKKARESARANKYPHHLGHHSYSRAEQEWISSGRLSHPPPTSSTPTMVDGTSSQLSGTLLSHRILNRGKYWKLAHEKKFEDGSWGIDPFDKETLEVVKKIDENLEVEAKAMEEGIDVKSSYGLDSLSKAIGRDHRGRPRCIGGINVGIQQIFGKSTLRGQKRKGVHVTPLEELTRKLVQMEAEIDLRVEERIASKVEEYLRNALGSKLIELSMNQSPLPQGSVSKSPPLPPPVKPLVVAKDACNPCVKDFTKISCHLAVKDNCTDDVIIVADGTWYRDFTIIHNDQMLSDHYKVTVDNPYPEHKDTDLPVPSPDGEATKVGDAKKHFLQWPSHLVIPLDSIEPFGKKTKEVLEDLGQHNNEFIHDEQVNIGEIITPRLGKDSWDPQRSVVAQLGTLVEKLTELNFDDLGEECQVLRAIIDSAMGGFQSIVITIKHPMFYYKDDGHIVVRYEDIDEILKGKDLNISVIQIYQRFLMDEYSYPFNIALVSFLCPSQISAQTTQSKPSQTREYIRDAFMDEIQKGDKQSRFILAPYIERNHWYLFIIELRAGQMFVLNSSKNLNNYQGLKIWEFFKLSYRIYKTQGGKHPKVGPKDLRVIELECPQQLAGTECGYYVMKYMFEIVTMYSDCRSSLKEDYFETQEPYTIQEINVIREHWAKFFRTKYLSS